MTDVDEAATHPPVGGVAEPGSLKERVQARRRELERGREVAIVLDVPGYEGTLAVQYRPLGMGEMFDIENRYSDERESFDKYVRMAVDKLIAACERIVEPTGADEYQDTGYRWNVKAATELFGLDLPEGTTVRQAMLAVFGASVDDGEAISDHARDYERERKAVMTKLDRRVEGESAAA